MILGFRQSFSSEGPWLHRWMQEQLRIPVSRLPSMEKAGDAELPLTRMCV